MLLLILYVSACLYLEIKNRITLKDEETRYLLEANLDQPLSANLPAEKGYISKLNKIG